MVALVGAIMALCQIAYAQEFPKLSGRVVDEAGILSASQEQALFQKLQEWEEQSSDQVVVATIGSLEGYEIERYAVELARHWALGVGEDKNGRELNNGVLFLIAPEARKVRIEVGYGLEGTLSDVLAHTIIREAVLPAFRSGDYPGGIDAGVTGIIEILSGNVEEWQERGERGSRPRGAGEGNVPWPLIIFIFVIFLILFLDTKRSGRPVVFDSDPRASRRHRGVYPGYYPGAYGSGGWGGSYGGGGFSGGGGSFGGGGASGSW